MQCQVRRLFVTRRVHMGCLQLRRWLSFLPAAFVVYLLLHYLVYQPDLSSPQQSPLIDEGLARLNESVVGVAGGSRSLQSGPRVLPPLTPQELSVPTPLSEEPLPAEASPGGRRPDASSGTSQLPGVTVNQGAAAAASQAATNKGSSSALTSSSSSPSSSNSSSPSSPSAGQGGAGNEAAPPSQSQAQPPPQSQAPAQPQAPPQAPEQPVVVQGTGSAPQPKQTVTKKTAVVKKTNNAASGSSALLAINFLKGKQKLGERYESGFSVPHEELCLDNGRELKVLVLITSAPDHQKHRLAVRQTWGHFGVRRDVVLAFMVGRTLNGDTQANLDRENDLYGDIIQANFIDHYSNLTLKTISMFEWVKTYCSESHFVLKTDDDMFINMPLLISFVDSKSTEQRVLYGRMAKGWKPVRNKKSKYYIDAGTYSRTRYPDFLTGPAYLFTSDVVEDIYHKTLDTTFFPLEDVLVTGIVGESLRLRRVGDSRFRNEKIKLTDTCSLLKTVSIHMVKYEEQFDIYKRTLDGKAKCKTGEPATARRSTHH
ncbi:UDP-GlcNAc:betaGal beta-1,3-N-acetylglucosaminyltransferase 7-like isoform X2 [Portunus trituberculatus]|uniref:UDP-GlcNAc:betaGal beta-1,3-N-acetylglucosaminyltransferase 7-like isoform X2 n=1 Tax=Portunus trituberculatus TaxID=210409 RepID=UPI001E1D1BCD|nr:UDP-GlcNAc:betaGal beta-1,3-N-acetylglucosaminyltransferase 7-like isoform X2 [Portunus trituberculatus]